MDQILYALTGHMWTFIVVFLVLFTALSYLFLKEKFGYTFVGLFLGILSIFYSPFLYLREKIIRMTEFGEKGENKFKGVPNYLLMKFIIILEIALTVSAVAIFTSAVVTGYNAMLPPQYLRDRITAVENDVSTMKNELNQITSKIETMDKNWVNQKENATKNFKETIKNEIQQKNNELKEIGNNLINVDESSSGYVTQVFNEIKANQQLKDEYAINSFTSSIREYLNNQYYIAYTVKEILFNYLNTWSALKNMQNSLNNISEENVRNNFQPDYSSLIVQKANVNGNIQASETYLVQLRTDLKYDFKSMFMVLLAHLGIFILYIWAGGMLIELLGLNVKLANDISGIRDQMANKG